MTIPATTMTRQCPADDWALAIVGAGASGMMAAIAAARLRPGPILLLEKEARVGRKLMATGNGRCNLMNLRPEATRYHGSGAPVALEMLQATPPQALLDIFAAMGLVCREEAEGRVYPFSGQANAVLDVLREACDGLGVHTRTGAVAVGIARAAQGFAIRLSDGGEIGARRVIIAGGGKASPALGSDGSAAALLASLGHTITPLYPAIVPLKVPAWRVRGLKGIRVQATLTLLVDGQAAQMEQGEALFGEQGISGIAAMQLARRAGMALSQGRGVALSIRLMPPDMARAEMQRRAARLEGTPFAGFFTGLLHRRLGESLLRDAGIAADAPVSQAAAATLAALLPDWQWPVQGTLPFAQAQVTAGGALAGEFNPQTLESRIVPGLHACGEVLDVDGDCGGYNLMWAWLSGEAAGRAAASD